MRLLPTVTGVLLASMAHSVTAFAQATPEGAADLQLAIKQWITDNLAPGMDGIQLVFDGGLTVEPAGPGYLARFGAPRMTIDNTIEIGMAGFDVSITPRSDGWYDASWVLPSQIDIGEAGGGDHVALLIGSNTGTGAWAPELGNFAVLDMVLADISAAIPDGMGGIGIDRMAMTTDSTQRSPGVYDMISQATLEGLAVQFAGSEVLSLGRMSFDYDIGAVDFSRYGALNEEFAALFERYGELQDTPPAEFWNDIRGMAAGGLPFDGLSMEYGLEDLAIDAEGTPVELDGGRFGVSIGGLQGAATSIGMSFGFNALGISPPVPFAEFVPTDAAFDIGVVDLPNEALGRIVMSFLDSSARMGPEAAGMSLIGELQQAIVTSGSQIQIRELSVRSDTGSIAAEGVLRPDAAAAFGAIADATIELGGLEQVVAAVRALPPEQQEGAVEALTLLQSMGQQTTDTDGNPVRRYEFELTPAGQFLLNGTDMAPLMQDAMP